MKTQSIPLSGPPPSVAVIGCGAITEMFYLPALTRYPAMKDKITLVDSNLARARQVAEKFQVTRYVSDYREILNSVSACIVAVPHHLHFAISKDFLSAGAHVLCEKPIAETPGEVKEMISIAAAHGVTISVNNTRRIFPSNEMVKQLLTEGAIGKIRSISFVEGGEFDWPTATGFYFDWQISKKGVLFDQGSHVLDLLCWWLGGKPAIVRSENDSFGGCESVAGLALDYQGCHCTIRLSRLNRLSNTFEIVGERGTISGEPFTWRSIVHTDAAGKITKHQSPEEEMTSIPRRLMANFLAVAQGTAQPLIPASEVLETVELLEIAYAKATRFEMPWYTARKELIHEH